MLDVPAAIRKIKQVSSVDKVAYIGGSQGTSIMFYALTKDVEESFFADNMSCFIALAPCMISPNPPYSYDTFIETEWQGLERYPNFLGYGWDTQGYCEATSNGIFCNVLPYIEGAPGVASCDTRSMFQLSQVALEGRFQAWSEEYDKPERRKTELADITKIDKVPVFLINAMQEANCETNEGVEQIS